MAGALPKPNDPVVPAAAAGCEPKAGVAAWFVDEGCPKAKLGAPDVGAATDAAGLLAFPNENEGVVELGAGVALPFGAPKLKPAEDEAGAALLPPKLKPDCKALEVTAGLPKEKLGALLVGGADGTLDGDSSIKSVGKGAIPVGVFHEHIVIAFILLHLCLLDLVCQGRYGVALVLLLGDNFQGVDAQGDL